jgi:small subunit ribosomal protein S16
MAVRIRLRRIGKNPKKRPFFRVSVFEETRSRDGRFIEEIGYYDPAANTPVIKLNRSRYDFWLKKGALPSDTVRSLARKTAKTEV